MTLFKQPEGAKVLVFSPGFIPSVVIGVLKPLIELEKLGEIVLRVRPLSIRIFSSRDIRWCDVAVFCRSCEQTDLYCLYELKRLGKRIIYEIDDNFEEISLDTPLGLYHRSVQRLHTLRRFYLLADITRTYSLALKNCVERHGGTVCLVRGYFNSSLIQNEPKPYREKVIKIVYPTHRVDPPLLEAFISTILYKILLKYKQNIEVHLWSSTVSSQLSGFNQVFLHSKVANYEDFVKSFYAKGFDIGLAPLLDTPFFHAKTNNKYRELAGTGVVGVYSNLPPYSESVIEGKTGLLADNTIESWVEKISALVDNLALRQSISETAQYDVIHNYSFSQAVASYRKSINDVLNSDSKPCHWLYDKNYRFSAAGVMPQKSNRADCVAYAMSLLRGEFSLFQSTQDLLTTRDIIKNYNFVIFFINSLDELSYFNSVVLCCNSIVLDLSEFREDSELFISKFMQFELNKPMILILNDSQIAIQTIAITLNLSFITIKCNPAREDNDFSLIGYPAVYLDIFERHIRHEVIKKSHLVRIERKMLFYKAKKWIHYRISKQKLQQFVIKFKKNYALNLIKLCVVRIEQVWLFLQWRFGRRL